MSNDDKVLCSYCLHPMPPAAKKCSACLEFTVGNKLEAKPSTVEITKAILECLGKLGIPLAIIIFLVLFRSDMAGLFARAHTAKFGENTITFDLPKLFTGTIDLHPIALYWLMEAVKNPDTSLRYDYLTPDDFSGLDELTKKGLGTYSVVENKPMSKADARYFGTKAVKITTTSKGFQFLKEIGLELPTSTPGNRQSAPEHRPEN